MNDNVAPAPKRTRYAEGTKVDSIQSRMEIERNVVRFGAEKFASYSDTTCAIIGFEMNGRKIQFRLELPDRNERRFTHVNKGRTFDSWHARTPESASREYELAIRERWRALALLIKAKLAAVESGITTVEEEFLPQTIVPTATGTATVSEMMQPQVEEAYQRGNLPAGLVLALGPGRD